MDFERASGSEILPKSPATGRNLCRRFWALTAEMGAISRYHDQINNIESVSRMTTIKKDEYVFEVDLENTRAYYQSHDLCECDNCTYFYRKIKGMFPKLEEFLSDFGVDVSRPDHIFSAEAVII